MVLQGVGGEFDQAVEVAGGEEDAAAGVFGSGALVEAYGGASGHGADEGQGTAEARRPRKADGVGACGDDIVGVLEGGNFGECGAERRQDAASAIDGVSLGSMAMKGKEHVVIGLGGIKDKGLRTDYLRDVSIWSLILCPCSFVFFVFVVHSDECTGKGECFAVGGEDGWVDVSGRGQEQCHAYQHDACDDRHNGNTELERGLQGS